MKRFWKDESGQDLVEYSLLLGFLALAIVGSYQTIQTNIISIWNRTGSYLSQAAGSGS